MPAEELPATLFLVTNQTSLFQLIRTVLSTVFLCGVIPALVLVLICECQDQESREELLYCSCACANILDWSMIFWFNETGTQPRLSHCGEFRWFSFPAQILFSVALRSTFNHIQPCDRIILLIWKLSQNIKRWVWRHQVWFVILCVQMCKKVEFDIVTIPAFCMGPKLKLPIWTLLGFSRSRLELSFLSRNSCWKSNREKNAFSLPVPRWTSGIVSQAPAVFHSGRILWAAFGAQRENKWWPDSSGSTPNQNTEA